MRPPLSGDLLEPRSQLSLGGKRQRVEHREVGRDLVAIRRIVGPAKAIQPGQVPGA